MVKMLSPIELKDKGVTWKWHFTPEGSGFPDHGENDSPNVLLIGAAAALFGRRMQERGYKTIAADTVLQARNVLLVEYFSLQRPLPDAIICDICLDEQLISHFAMYLSVTPQYAGIPFIAVFPSSENEDDGGDTDLSGPYGPFDPSKLKGVDDVCSAGASVSDLCAKIGVLSKYKRLKQTLPYRSPEVKEEPLFPSPGHFFQRAVDIALSATALVVLSPVMLAIAAAIKLDSRGSVFYSSPRAGKSYKIFKFYKFRTMVADADKKIDQLKHLNQYDVNEGTGGPRFFKLDNDPRVTRLGRFLRNTSLDEIPQLFNVLNGDMSLVGNRPLPLYEAATLTADESARRFLAPAGITGLWQIKKRGQPNMSVQERINLDIDYANRHSFFYDMRILLNTPRVLMQKANV
jgi:lipopolysaccharide/colanic/teichoic acid biosynthesis glycosyltransferase